MCLDLGQLHTSEDTKVCKPVQAEGGLHSNEGQLLPCHETEVYKAVQTELGAGDSDLGQH